MKYNNNTAWRLLVVALPFTSASSNSDPQNETPNASRSQSGQKCSVCYSCKLPPLSLSTSTIAQHTYDPDTTLSYPASSWLLVNCDGSGSGNTQEGTTNNHTLDLRNCGNNRATSENFWTPVDSGNNKVKCQDSFVTSETESDFSNLHIECTSPPAPPAPTQEARGSIDAIFTANIRVDDSGKLRCQHISGMAGDFEPEPRQQGQATPEADSLVVRAVQPHDNDDTTSFATSAIGNDELESKSQQEEHPTLEADSLVVRAVQSHANNSTVSSATATPPPHSSSSSSPPVATGSKSNSTMIPTSTNASSPTTAASSTVAVGPAKSCSVVPDRAFRPPGHNGSVCDDVFVETKTGGAGRTAVGICGTLAKELLFGLAVYTIMVIVGLI